MEEQTRILGRVRLKEDLLVFLRELLIEDRDQFFEDKRLLEADGKPSYLILRDIRRVEKILRTVEGALWDLESRKAEASSISPG